MENIPRSGPFRQDWFNEPVCFTVWQNQPAFIRRAHPEYGYCHLRFFRPGETGGLPYSEIWGIPQGGDVIRQHTGLGGKNVFDILDSQHSRGEAWTRVPPLLQNARNLERLRMGSESRADSAERQSILVVDDERPVVESLVGALKGAGYWAFGADSGNEAIKLFEVNRVDLVLLEFALPDNSGDVVGRRMKLLKPKVPIIIFTVLPDVANECCDFAEVVIAKPQHPESVIERVKEVLGQRV
jgi:CheY-like chemotaxis protein